MPATIHLSRPSWLRLTRITWLAALLCGWLAADPRTVLNFWPGVLLGALGIMISGPRWQAPDAGRAQRRLRAFSVVLMVWFVLGMLPQRDIPMLAAPFGVWVSLTAAAAMDHLKWRRL